jgi:flavodoxin
MANLIAYFSHTGENYFNGDIRPIEKGNTERVAEFIQQAVGGDLFEITAEDPYPDEYFACVSRSKQELDADMRPAITSFVESLDGYDTIFVGYPNWCGTCPMCVFTFLDHYDLDGKKIAPFCTNEGSGMGRSERHLKRLYPKAEFVPGLAIHGAEAADSQQEVAAWAKTR